ncbi:hypothetical protein FJR45_05545 [Sulfurimonas sediminis]|uniref:Polymerase beta nucleotidyltransferase domain-containing protein n=1 Tax=Sulfurimonas sediminis TaxID=2590020 RepID=A0A7M1B145_9BACT|nr:nucleotidyltransferase domain-containing protein [Sulfurimonas sediminis]QOP43443.1 hypothetical protein FJR45_05545 [Sulfurimonas sediminis]
MINKNIIIQELKNIKPLYEKEGIILVGLFGSYAQDKQHQFSDIDIAYKMDYKKFSQKYKDGFSKLLRIDAIKNELTDRFKTRVDLVPDENKKLFDRLLYV